MAEKPQFQNVADLLRQGENAKAVIVLMQHHDGTMSLVSNGCESHAEANSMLSLGIHLNLKQHDELVLAGAAGAQAQAVAQAVATEQEAANV